MASPPNHHHTTPNSTSILKQSSIDEYLSNSTHLSRQHVLNRRSHNMQQLSKCYRDHYWALMEDVRVRYREYVWKFGMSPFVVEDVRNGDDVKNDNVKIEQVRDGSDDVIIDDAGDLSDVSKRIDCGFNGCNKKAMMLTRFCHAHILSDPKQQLYKPCEFLVKSTHAGHAPCGKPVLRSVVPLLCSMHYLKAQQHVVRALRKAGVNITCKNKCGAKFHVIVTEYVKEIQEKRKKNGLMADKKMMMMMPKLEFEN